MARTMYSGLWFNFSSVQMTQLVNIAIAKTNDQPFLSSFQFFSLGVK